MTKFRISVLVTVLLAFTLVAVGVTNKALQAGTVEEAVITQAFDDFFETAATDYESWDETTFDAHMADFYEIYEDLPSDTYCEAYASAGYLLAHSGDAINEQTEMAALFPIAMYVIDDLDRLQDACAQEDSF
jgi:hypothetical protein